MQNALWLHKALESTGRLSHPLSAAELYELGRSVTKGNNTRVLDARKRTQLVLHTVDDYLQQKGLINKTDITYFSNLNDILFFAFNSFRLSGNEIFIRFIPKTEYLRDDMTQSINSSNTKRRTDNKSILLSAGFNSYIPIDLHHQHNFGASLNLSYLSHNLSDKYLISGNVVNEFLADPIIKKASINLFYQHAIYPGTRTIIGFYYNSEWGYQDVSDETGFYGTVNFTASFNYFISYRTRFRFDLGCAYNKNMYRVYQYLEMIPNTFLLNANAGLEVSL